MADAQWRRAYALTINTIRTSDLRIQFEITKELAGKPNQARFTINGLNPDHRTALGSLGEVPVQFDAGYLEGMSTLFLGTIRGVISWREPREGWITQIGGTDGGPQIQRSRVAVSIAKGTPVETVFRQVATALGVREGNLSSAVNTLRANFGSRNVWPHGTVLVGSASREMSALCRAFNLEWTVHNGALQIQERGKVLAGTAILLTPSTGLINRPEVDNKGVVKAQCLLQKDVFPGRLAVIQTADGFKEQIRITKTTHQGDTHGGDWTIQLEGKRY